MGYFVSFQVCVSARLCQSLVLGAYSYLQDPGNDYLLSTAAKGWNVLDIIWNTPQTELMRRWKKHVTAYQE